MRRPIPMKGGKRGKSAKTETHLLACMKKSVSFVLKGRESDSITNRREEG